MARMSWLITAANVWIVHGLSRQRGPQRELNDAQMYFPATLHCTEMGYFRVFRSDDYPSWVDRMHVSGDLVVFTQFDTNDHRIY